MPGVNFFDTKECEWDDTTIYIGGVAIGKLTAFSFKTKKEKKALHARGSKPISIQHGNRDFEGSLSVLKGVLDNLNTAARAAGGDDVLDVSFDVVSVFRAKGSRELQTRTAIGVEFSEYNEEMKQGATEMEVTLPFMFLDWAPVPVL